MLQLWSRKPFLSKLSLKLSRSSTEGGRQLAPPQQPTNLPKITRLIISTQYFRRYTIIWATSKQKRHRRDLKPETTHWSGYEQDTVQWVKQCEQCQKRNPPQSNLVAPMGTIAVTRPFEKLSWDIMGPLPTSSRGNKYILVITDFFSKWVEAFPLKNTTATTLATTML